MSFLPEKLVMIDGEFTGVDPTKYELLQAAFIKLQLGKDCQYHEVEEPLVLYFKHDGVPQNNFHRKYLTHVFEKCNESDLMPEQAKEMVHEWLGDWKGVATPTGDCVHTDLEFLKHNNVIDRNDIVKDESVPGTFHYEAFEMHPLKCLARHKVNEKFTVAGIDEENIHDALVDCRNQALELNESIKILVPELVLVNAGAFKELAIEEEDRRRASVKDINSQAISNSNKDGYIWDIPKKYSNNSKLIQAKVLSNLGKQVTTNLFRAYENCYIFEDKKMNTKRRILTAAHTIDPLDLPKPLRPVLRDDGKLSEDKREVVLQFKKKSLRADSFQDFQELLNTIMLEAQLIEDFRPSVAGILNEYRVQEGYVAL